MQTFLSKFDSNLKAKKVKNKTLLLASFLNGLQKMLEMNGIWSFEYT